MQTIRVMPVPQAVPAYATAEEAILASKQDDLSWVARSQVIPLLGQKIQMGWWSGECVRIRVESSPVISIRCNRTGIICEVDTPDLPLPKSIDNPTRVDLLFDSGVLKWDRKVLIEGLVGKTVVKMQRSGCVLFLYASDLPTICFFVLQNRDTGELLLFWEESD
ncbi:MAG: hypothetical protein ACLP7Q_09475 [Isosphaeraceae bacterium]